MGLTPGRKRSAESRLAILAAALELVGEVGFAGLTIEGIAARAGTGKQTVYRWWPSKADVLLDALATQADLQIPIPDEGSYAADVHKFLTATFALGRQGWVVEVLRVLMAQAQIDEEFGERFRAEFLQRRRDALGVIVDRARERGDLPASPPPGLLADLVFGVIWYRVLARHRPLAEGLPDELTATLTGAARPGARPAQPHSAQPQSAHSHSAQPFPTQSFPA
ncbi:MAG TPA: TetR/AcrR family transcriptional regulator [Streptosporangiaceae bacterium]|nr:TetR/AcrR family transcriptional regulator [Streptosporangiaceae bacterium]